MHASHVCTNKCNFFPWTGSDCKVCSGTFLPLVILRKSVHFKLMQCLCFILFKSFKVIYKYLGVLYHIWFNIVLKCDCCYSGIVFLFRYGEINTSGGHGHWKESLLLPVPKIRRPSRLCHPGPRGEAPGMVRRQREERKRSLLWFYEKEWVRRVNKLRELRIGELEWRQRTLGCRGAPWRPGTCPGVT